MGDLVGADWTFMRLIPAPPLLAAAVLTLGSRWPQKIPVQSAVSLLTLGAAGIAFLFSVLAFAQLLASDEASALVDPVAIWVGLGVGDASLSGDFVFRLDTLSTVFCLVISGIALLGFFYSLLEMRRISGTDADYARFFCFANFQVASTLALVLAENMPFILLAYAGVVVGNGLLTGFQHSDAQAVRAGRRALVSGWLGQGALLLATLLAFRSLSDLGVPTLAVHALRSAIPQLVDDQLLWVGVWGGVELGLLTVLGLCVLVAASALASQLPFIGWLPGASRAPLSGTALIQTTTSLMAGGYLIARFSFLFTAAPVAAETMAWLGGFSALFAALLASRRHHVGQVLAWSSVSQFGLVWIAAGAGAQTAAVFHLVGHAFSKSLLLMATGVVVLALMGEQDMRKMGHLSSRLTLTRLAFWVGGFSLVGGLPLTVGFFSIHQILVAAQGAQQMASHGALVGLVLVTLGVSVFYTTRMLLLILYGETHLPQNVHLEEVGDPEASILWSLGILGALSILGSIIGFPQFWADFFFAGDIENSNSLHYFLSGVVSTVPETTLGAAETWSLTGWTFGASVLGLAAGLGRYSVRPAWMLRVERDWDRLRFAVGPPLTVLQTGFGNTGMALNKFFVRELGDLRPRWMKGEVLEGVSSRGGLSLSAGLLRYFALHLLKFFQSGVAQHYLAISVIGSFVVLIYFLWVGRG